MASFKAVLKGKSIYVQAIHKRKAKRVKLFDVNPDHWDKNKEKVTKSDPNHHRKNQILYKKITELRSRFLKLKEEEKPFTVLDIFNDANSIMLSEVISSYPTRSERHNHQLQRKYDNARDKIIEYKDIPIKDVNKKYLIGFMEFLKSHPNINSLNTVNRYIKFIQTAIRGSNVDSEVFQIKRPSQVVNKGVITIDEFNIIKSLELNGREEVSRDIFLAQISQAGTRVGDILRLTPENLENGYYNERKTGKVKHIIVNKLFTDLVDKYEGLSNYYVFPILTKEPEPLPLTEKYYKSIESKTALINRDLKLVAVRANLSINLTTSTSRNSFASWGANQGININVLQDLFNHSSSRTTEGYIQSLNKQSELQKIANSIIGELD